MQVASGFTGTRVGLISTEPMRLMGLMSAFEGHPSIRIHIDDIETLLADSSLHYLILDVDYSSPWLELQAKVRRLRPDVRQILLGPAGDEELVLRSITAGGRMWTRTADRWRCGKRWNR
jgi:hypothetical protein